MEKSVLPADEFIELHSFYGISEHDGTGFWSHDGITASALSVFEHGCPRWASFVIFFRPQVPEAQHQ